tara:strand:+ start:1175 stop:2146 length:972 start_codon:yes stop_codon:yes gene_type:complete
MTKNTKIFLAAFAVSLPFWWGVNILNLQLEEFFLYNQLAKNPQMFTAQAKLLRQVQKIRPVLKSNSESLSLNARAATSVLVRENSTSKVLFQDSPQEPFPIASLTKLMTAYVVAEHFLLEQEIVISKSAIAEEESFGQLRVGDRFTMRDLLYPLLMESSNDAAAAFALHIGKEAFVDLMNLETKRLGLTNTKFVNHAGLDPDDAGGPINYSTTKDLFLLTRSLKEQYPDIFSILALQEQPLYTLQGSFHHTMANTNELLANNGWPTRIVGGKTGWTPEAQGALILVLESPKNKGYVVNIILYSPARFEEMKKLVDWVYNSYLW